MVTLDSYFGILMLGKKVLGTLKIQCLGNPTKNILFFLVDSINMLICVLN